MHSGVDAGFEDLCWQAYSDTESKTLELSTMDLADAVLMLTEHKYAVVAVARHAKLIYVLPVPDLPIYTSREFFASALSMVRRHTSNDATIKPC